MLRRMSRCLVWRVVDEDEEEGVKEGLAMVMLLAVPANSAQ